METVFKHPANEQMQVEVILASRHAYYAEEKPIFTVRLRYPRIIHSEIMTHRVFGRNARSSRAVPVAKMLEEIRNIPFVPWHWGKNKRGMQAVESNDAPVRDWMDQSAELDRETAWLKARDNAVDAAQAFSDANYHKQLVNRLIEPFSWIDTLITANRWENFFWLRDHKDAEPHIRDLAVLMKQAFDDARIQFLTNYAWHRPYISDEDTNEAIKRFPDDREERETFLNKISAARCARISYAPFDGDASYDRELERYNMLVSSDRVHASPLEHQAIPDRRIAKQSRWVNPGLHGNLPGWIQARKLVSNEAIHA